jgi:phosphate/sulfate permease
VEKDQRSGASPKPQPLSRVATSIATQTKTAIIGVGATRRVSAVRWEVTFEMVTAWILTFAVCGAIGWLATKLFMFFQLV